MKDETIIPQIAGEANERVRRIASYHYGFEPANKDIERTDEMLRNEYAVLHEQRIMRHLAAAEITRPLLKHRDRIGSGRFEEMWLDKRVFRYLTFASMSFRAGIPIATISLCRTAIEAGLRERLAEELARRECTQDGELPGAVLEKMRELEGNSLGTTGRRKGLIELAEENDIISRKEIEEAFGKFRFGGQNSRRILDKFMHGDFVWIARFIKEKDQDATVQGARDILQEHKIIADFASDDIAFELLKAATRIAEILYFRD